MMSLNGPRPAVPSTLPFIGATTDRKAAAATESSWLSGWITDQGRSSCIEVISSPVSQFDSFSLSGDVLPHHPPAGGTALEIRKVTLTPLGRLRTSVSK